MHPNPYLVGYARVSTTSQSLDQQSDALKAAGVPVDRIYSDKLAGKSPLVDRPGISAALVHLRGGDVLVVVGIDRLGRDTAEVMSTVKELTAKGIVIRSLREGIDSSTSAGRMVIGVLASLAELELELGRERRAAAREARRVRGLDTGRPKALTAEKRSQLARLAASGEPVSALAGTFGISTRTAYRIVREERDSSAA